MYNRYILTREARKVPRLLNKIWTRSWTNMMRMRKSQKRPKKIRWLTQTSPMHRWFRTWSLRFYLATTWPLHQLNPGRTMSLMRCLTSTRKRAKVGTRWSQEMMHRMPVTKFMRNFVASTATRPSIPLRKSSTSCGWSMTSTRAIFSRDRKPTVWCKTLSGCDGLRMLTLIRFIRIISMMLLVNLFKSKETN